MLVKDNSPPIVSYLAKIIPTKLSILSRSSAKHLQFHVKDAEWMRIEAATHPQRSQHPLHCLSQAVQHGKNSSRAQDEEQGLKTGLHLRAVQRLPLSEIHKQVLKRKNYIFYTNKHFITYTQCQGKGGEVVPLFRHRLQALAWSSTSSFLEFLRQIFLSPFCSQMVL